MHYPVMTEKQANRWQLSLKTLRRWRLDCYVRRYSGLADAGCPEDFSSRLEIEA